jgi:hypothetical protein
MAWDDGREDLDRIIEKNRMCPADEAVCEWYEWRSPDGLTWSSVDDDGNIVVYNPEGEDIVRNFFEEGELESVDRWYAENFGVLTEKYGGKVIAVINEEVIAVEDTEKKADEAARKKYPGNIPAFVTYIPKAEELECLL